MILSYFVSPALSQHHLSEIQSKLNSKLFGDLEITRAQSEYGYYVQIDRKLNLEEEDKLKWILKPFDGVLSNTTFFAQKDASKTELQVEIGPRLNFSTPFSTNAVSVCSSINLPVSRVERSTRSGGPRVAVIREEGINGDREMIASLFMAGFEVWDVTMTDLLTKKVTLSKFQGIVFPGGFSYADVLGSARGWAAGLLFHSELESQFTAFKNRPDTFSLGVCNGCQLMALLGWVGSTLDDKGNVSQGVSLQPNISERFESRFVTVKIQESPSIMMKGMENSILGVWVAHGEGRFQFKAHNILDDIKLQNLIPIVYTDDNGMPTEEYPLNPNGSVGGIAAVCSEDGRHIAMMPHPERCVLPWQWAWMPDNWKENMKVSPWLKMFVNAYDWCCRR